MSSFRHITSTHKKLFHGVRVAMLGVVLLAAPAYAQLEFETKAKFALLMDFESGALLYQKNADERMEPASMAKLITIAVVMDMLKSGRLSTTDEFFISEHAWRDGGASSGGSTMFAELNSKVAVLDLLKSVIIQSGNDASIALAEGIGGSETTFARIMNEKAREIGMKDSNFTNAAGLPDPDMYVTSNDLAILAQYIISEFPEYYGLFSQPDFEWNNIKQRNRNTLLSMDIGVDGLKTGHTEAAGYGEVVSTTEGGRRLIAVLHGLESIKERSEEARKLVTWGTRNFERVPAFSKDDTIGEIPVYGGQEPNVALVGRGDIDLYLPKGAKKCLTASIAYRSPILPPVEKGQKLADLQVRCDKQLIQSAPLFAAEPVAKGSVARQAIDALKELAIGWL